MAVLAEREVMMTTPTTTAAAERQALSEIQQNQGAANTHAWNDAVRQAYLAKRAQLEADKNKAK
jgi:actin-like ATPase involved in cell morphogenesis